ncbi:unnamed protein product [Adineta steineri]|uniref:PRKR-like endoplasmic reticulum kinase n=2 Tax=Adineta steineri TaxID=433720 RepID=A0A818I368_9BILA|nr:unnamed protein product [Adineta steineri]CAF3517603.1 unnamed protein product [Adineta steineri]
MYRYRRNVRVHLSFFIRQQFWPIFIPSIAILFLTYCPQLSQSIQINTSDYNQHIENSDRTVAKRGSRDIILTTTVSPIPLSIPLASSAPSTSGFDDSIHTLYVISLDGKITALNAHENGRQIWSADIGAPLVESSLSKIEIPRDSRSVRLIPSLLGGLFEKYEEDGHIEPLPLDADALLDASYKLHDELVINGGKHIDTLGLDLQTGQILYSFLKDDSKEQNTLNSNRTTTTSTDNNDHKATLVIKRITQTVKARSARNGYEKWNFSVSNNELLYLRAQSAPVVFGQVDIHSNPETTFSGYFQYQLQTGVVLAFDKTGHSIWSSAINAPIAAVWELKNGELKEKSLFDTTIETNDLPKAINLEEEDLPPPPLSRRLAFIGEFNSTPYVIVSPKVQKELIYDAKRKNIPGSIGHRGGPVLSSWHKAYQKRTLSVGSEITEENYQRTIGMPASENNYPLALRPDPAGGHHQPHASAASVVETCDTAGYLELIPYPADYLIEEENNKNNLINNLNTHSNMNLSGNPVAISTVVFGALIIMFYWYYKHKQTKILRQQSLLMSQSSTSLSMTPPPTPEYHQLEQPLTATTPPFQSRYTLEYEHVRFLGRGGFGVVFEAINKLDERRVAIKRVSLKKASGKERALKEIRYLAVLNHPNLIQYYYAWNESPPIGWQEEEDKTLLVRNSTNNRDSISTFPTSAASGNDSESINQGRSPRQSCVSAVYAMKPSATTSPPPLFEITFDRSSNPLRIDEDFSANSINNNNNDKSEISSTTSSSSLTTSSSDEKTNHLDANNNNKSKKTIRLSVTKSSFSSSSPFFDHSSDSSLLLSHDEHLPNKDNTESDDGIVFLHDAKRSPSSSSLIPIQTTKSLTEKPKIIMNEKDTPITFFYFVMELCQPESLRDRLIQRDINRFQAWSIFDQIIKGIEYIHSQKLIHRDLKPSNILFSLDGTVKIGDFGLVSAFGEDKLAKKKKRDDEKIDSIPPIETISSTTDGGGNNELGGTILYMSPEQMHREPYNQKVDIYAMGIILFELLYPFSTQMERMQAIANVRLENPVFPVDFEHDASNRNRNQLICRLIRWLLSYSPHNRPRASELRQDTFYQRMLQLEIPHLLSPDNRQQNQTIVDGQDQTPVCQQQQRGRLSSSSPFRRTMSSSALQSFRESDSGDMECAS